MFEPISENLTQFAAFTILGFFLGVLYEPLRIIRLFKKQGTVVAGIQDFLFLSSSGIISFAYSMELGSGSFRLFYLVGEIFGAFIYFITIGKLISMISNVIVKIIKFIFRTLKKHIYEPFLHFIIKINKFLQSRLAIVYKYFINKLKNELNHLKGRLQIVYNSKKQGKKNKGKSKNVIKAKIRSNSD